MFLRGSAMVGLMLIVTACASGGSPDPSLTETSSAPSTEQLPPGPWKAVNISQALSGKTFSYVNGGKSGQVTYNGDFTFVYQEEGKGQGSGIWQPSDDSLCEAFDPSSDLPQGSPSRCLPFSTIGNAFAVGSKRLRPA